jgi:hypothetical protein
VRNYIFNNKQKESDALQKALDKQHKENEELATTIIMYFFYHSENKEIAPPLKRNSLRSGKNSHLSKTKRKKSKRKWIKSWKRKKYSPKSK